MGRLRRWKVIPRPHGVIGREVFPAIDKMAKDMGIDTVEFQDDNASPHKKVRSEIEEAGKNRGSGVGIEPYKQPPRWTCACGAS